ncbi:MAG TPA: hypothetical protein VGH78_05520, partial [Solirubrobacteraceae bacterium]
GHAFDIASASGSVLLRVEIAPSGATVTASAPPTAALVPLAAPERDPAPEAFPSSLSGSSPRPAAATVPLRRASDREPSTAAPALPGPI